MLAWGPVGASDKCGLLLASLLLLAGCADLKLPIANQPSDSSEPAALTLTAITFDELKGWEDSSSVIMVESRRTFKNGVEKDTFQQRFYISRYK